jgi:hypothetical protein
VLLRDKVEVLLRDLQAAVSRDDISVFNVLVIENAELPVGLLGTLSVLELGHLTEDGDLFDQRL